MLVYNLCKQFSPAETDRVDLSWSVCQLFPSLRRLFKNILFLTHIQTFSLVFSKNIFYVLLQHKEKCFLMNFSHLYSVEILRSSEATIHAGWDFSSRSRKKLEQNGKNNKQTCKIQFNLIKSNISWTNWVQRQSRKVSGSWRGKEPIVPATGISVSVHCYRKKLRGSLKLNNNNDYSGHSSEKIVLGGRQARRLREKVRGEVR